MRRPEHRARARHLFFVLFRGVDPTASVEALGKKLGFTLEGNNYINISMGQGQEAPAEQGLDNFAKNGGGVFLQNIHLMAGWLPSISFCKESVCWNI